MMARWFVEHPRSVGETYLEHLRSAYGFAGVLALAALACAVHGLAPALFQRTGSGLVKRLHDRMLVSRTRLRPVSEPQAPAQHEAQAQLWADYAI